MDRRIIKALIFSVGALIISIIFPVNLKGQFEQKLSLNITAGYFNTVGWNGHEENWEDHGPSLMPNFVGGISVNAGLQYNFSRYFSIEYQAGYSFAPGWYFDASDEYSESYNYLYYEIYDDATGTVLDKGENYMDMTNFHMAILPRYYFASGNRLNPFLYAGISLNYTDVYFENNEYEASLSANREDLYEENNDLINWFDYQVGVGFMAGAGIEYFLNNHLGLFVVARYHLVPMKESSFVNNSYLAHYHDIGILLGARISFLKSKEL